MILSRHDSVASPLTKFTELAFDESAEARWQESRPSEAVIPEKKFILLECCWIL